MSQSHGTASCRRPDTQSRPLLRAPTLETLRARVANHSAARNGGHTEYAVAVTETRTGAWAADKTDKRTLGGLVSWRVVVAFAIGKRRGAYLR